MITLANGFAARGHDVHFVVCRGGGALTEELSDAVQYTDLATGGVLKSLPGLVRFLRRTRPDALLSTLPHANVVAVWAVDLARTPTTVVVREAGTFSKYSLEMPRLRRGLLRRLVALNYSRAGAVVSVSDGVARDLRTQIGVRNHDMHVVANPIVNAAVVQGSKATADHPWMLQKGRDHEVPVVLGMGRLATIKRFDLLIEAVALCRRERRVRLLILGEGSERTKLERLAAERGFGDDFSLPGFVANPFALVRAASLFVLSSDSEGLPGALIQAMYCRTPVVATDCPSGPDEILQGGALAPLVPTGDAPAMASAILRALDDPGDLDACERRAHDFSEDKAVTGYLDLLLANVAPPRRRR